MPGSSPEHPLFNLQNASQLWTRQGLSKGMYPSRTSILASSFPCLLWGEHNCIYLVLLFNRSCRAAPTRCLEAGPLRGLGWAGDVLAPTALHWLGYHIPPPYSLTRDTLIPTRGWEESPCHRGGPPQPLEMLQTSEAFEAPPQICWWLLYKTAWPSCTPTVP